ncbi:hypothetical protein Tco_0754996, partial [Tanacetum coccineum]
DNIEALENVVDDEPHFFTEVIDNHLRALTMITKHFMSERRKWIVGSKWKKLWWQRVAVVADWWSVEVDPRENRRIACDGAGGAEVNGGGVVLGCSRDDLVRFLRGN